MPLKNERTNPYLVILKLLLFSFIIWFLYRKLIVHESEFRGLAADLKEYVRSATWWIILVLVPLNWGIEIAKWRYLTRAGELISWSTAARGVLSGLALGFITPHAIGDYAGRIATIPREHKLYYTGLVLYSRISQMVITGLFGMWGVYLLYSVIDVAVVAAVLLILCVLGFIAIKYITSGKRENFISTIGQYFRYLRNLTTRDHAVIMGLALFRYVVFSVQMILSIQMFTDIPLRLAAAGSGWIFLSKSILPSFNFLSDLGVREVSAVYFFEAFGISPAPVVAASLLIWCVNILLPTFAGALILLRVKFR